MYPDLSYFLHDVFGTEYDNWTSIFKTFGIFLGLLFFVSAIILIREFKRYESLGYLKSEEKQETIKAGIPWMDLVLNSLIGFVIGFKFPYIKQNFDAFKLDPASFIFSLEGNIAIGLLVFILFMLINYWSIKNDIKDKDTVITKIIRPHERVNELVIIAAIFGILGARIFSILENFDSFIADPIGQLFSGSGLTIYGGLILAFIACFITVKRWKMNPLHIMDLVAPVLMIGYAIGRLGCHFSGDGDWGTVATEQPRWWFLPDSFWSYHYPHNVADMGQYGPKIEGCDANFCTYLDPNVYTTPVWEAIICILIFCFLWNIRKRINIPGLLFFIYTFLNGMERLFIEFFRVNPRYNYFGVDLSQAQYIAIGLILVGLIGGFYLVSKNNKKTVS